MTDPMKPVITEIIGKKHKDPCPPGKWNRKKSPVHVDTSEGASTRTFATMPIKTFPKPIVMDAAASLKV